MSEKLPIGETVTEAFQFGLGHWMSLIRLAILPIIITIALYAAFFAWFFDLSQLFSDISQNPAAASETLEQNYQFSKSMIVGFNVASVFLLLIYSGVMASVYRLAASGEEYPGWFSLRLDGPAWRVFWAEIIIVILNYVIFAAAYVGIAAILGTDPGESLHAMTNLFVLAFTGETIDPTGIVLTGIEEHFETVGYAMIAMIIPVIYLNIKLIPFPAGAAIENRLVLFKSFAMTFGHFWSIIGVYLLMIAAIMAAAILAYIVLALVMVFAGVIFATFASEMGIIVVMGVVGLSAYIFVVSFTSAVSIGVRGIIYRRLAE